MKCFVFILISSLFDAAQLKFINLIFHKSWPQIGKDYISSDEMGSLTSSLPTLMPLAWPDYLRELAGGKDRECKQFASSLLCKIRMKYPTAD